MKTSFKKFIATICLISILVPSVAFVSYPKPANAILGVQIGTDWDFNNIMAHLKDFVLDKLAVTIAKQILHQLTMSVIDWINGGFNGSPSFLTNPQSFFLDAADQVTGVFLASETTPLKNLCGNLGIDIGLALAYGQVAPINARYKCTLGKIFSNVQNLPNRITVQGKSLTKFMQGDFSQGGWKGFLSLSQNPKNNATGAYLRAHGDLLEAIGIRKNALNKKLADGSGFLSWDSCETLDASEATISLGASSPNASFSDLQSTAVQNANDNGGVGQASIDTGDGTSVQAKLDANGNMTYKDCHTETPGSLVSSQIVGAMNVPSVELELANDINAVINALITQLITQLMSGGLGALSKSGSGGGLSATRNVIRDLEQRQAQTAGSVNLTGSNNTVAAIKAQYDTAVSLLKTSKTNYQSARSCFANKTGLSATQQTYALNQIALIDTAINTRVNPLLNQMLQKQADLASSMPTLNVSSTTDAQNLDALQGQLDTLQGSIAGSNSSQVYQSGSNTTNTSSTTTSGIAATDLQNTRTSTTQFNAEASQFLNLCLNLR